MTQHQFNMIISIIESGAPVLANELCNALNNLVTSHNNLARENEELKAKLTEQSSVEVAEEETTKEAE